MDSLRSDVQQQPATSADMSPALTSSQSSQEPVTVENQPSSPKYSPELHSLFEDSPEQPASGADKPSSPTSLPASQVPVEDNPNPSDLGLGSQFEDLYENITSQPVENPNSQPIENPNSQPIENLNSQPIEVADTIYKPIPGPIITGAYGRQIQLPPAPRGYHYGSEPYTPEETEISHASSAATPQQTASPTISQEQIASLVAVTQPDPIEPVIPAIETTSSADDQQTVAPAAPAPKKARKPVKKVIKATKKPTKAVANIPQPVMAAAAAYQRPMPAHTRIGTAQPYMTARHQPMMATYQHPMAAHQPMVAPHPRMAGQCTMPQQQRIIIPQASPTAPFCFATPQEMAFLATFAQFTQVMQPMPARQILPARTMVAPKPRKARAKAPAPAPAPSGLQVNHPRILFVSLANC